MPILKIDGKELPVVVGTTILEAALAAGVEIEHNCGGNCACSTCHVIVESGMENLSETSDDEEEMLFVATGLTLDSRLACQAQIKGDVAVRIPYKVRP